MKIKLRWSSQFCGTAEEIVDVVEHASNTDIKALFPALIGLQFDDNCSWEIINEDV